MYKIIAFVLLIYFVASKVIQNNKNMENLKSKNDILTEQLKGKELQIKTEKMKNIKLLENETIKELENKTKIKELEREKDFLITELEIVKEEENKILRSNKLSKLIYQYYYVGVTMVFVLLLFYLYGIVKIQSISERQKNIKNNQESINQTKKIIQEKKKETLVLNDILEEQIRKAINKKKEYQDSLKIHKQVSAQETKKINKFLQNVNYKISKQQFMDYFNKIYNKKKIEGKTDTWTDGFDTDLLIGN